MRVRETRRACQAEVTFLKSSKSATTPSRTYNTKMQSIRQIQRLNDAELEKCVPPNGSWHTDYRDTAYIYIGGLPFELSEGDVLTIFSQYGNPVHINLIRDKDTGKSKGFCFLKYEDQRSCDLAVDNLSGAGVMGRVLSVDHTRYKKKDGEIETVGDDEDEADETDREGDQRRKRRRSGSESEGERPMIKEEAELAQLMRDHDADDPMKAYLIEQKREEVQEALKNLVVKSETKHGERKHRHRHRHHRSRRDDDESDRDEDGPRAKDRRRRRSDDDSEAGDQSRRKRRGDDRDEDGNDHRTRNGHRSTKELSEDQDDSDQRSNGPRRRDRAPKPTSGREPEERRHRSRRDDSG